jgi:hypothetical protein
MLELFVVGTAWFWILIGIEVIVLFFCTAKELAGLALVSILAVLLALHFMGNVDVVGPVVNNPGTVALLIASYFLTGTIWSVCKWWFYVKERSRKYSSFRRRFLKNNQANETGEIPDGLKTKLKEEFQRQFGWDSAFKPRASEQKGRILFWMTWWPFSLTWTLINDPITRTFTAIYNGIAGLLQKISDSAFKEFDNDMPNHPSR